MKEKIDYLHFKKYTDIKYDHSPWLFRKRVYGAISLWSQGENFLSGKDFRMSENMSHYLEIQEMRIEIISRILFVPRC